METLLRRPNGKNPWPTVFTANILTQTLPARHFLLFMSFPIVFEVITGKDVTQGL